jgi:hypothetical protein
LDVEHEEKVGLTTFIVKHNPTLFLPNSRPTCVCRYRLAQVDAALPQRW